MKSFASLLRIVRLVFIQSLDNDNNWSDYLGICKELKEKIREKRKICGEELMTKVNNN